VREAKLKAEELGVASMKRDLLQRLKQVPYHITRPLAPSYILHTVLLKVESYNAAQARGGGLRGPPAVAAHGRRDPRATACRAAPAHAGQWYRGVPLERGIWKPQNHSVFLIKRDSSSPFLWNPPV
jgi:hypothetical protein